MDEAQLIKQFREISEQIEEKKSIIKDSHQKDFLNVDLNNLEKIKESKIFLLKSCTDKTLTVKKIENVKTILIQLNNMFSRKDYPHNFSRDQATIIHGEILLRIVDDISYAFENHERYSISEYFLEVDSEFNSDEILKILSESIQYLDTQKINNYIELFEFIKSLRKKIISLDEDCGRF